GRVGRRVGGRLGRLRARLARRGLLAAAAVRLVPMAPFAIVNVAAGVSPLRARDFLAGSALVLAPGTLVLALLAESVRHAVVEPGYWSLAVLTALLALAWAGFAWARRRVARQTA